MPNEKAFKRRKDFFLRRIVNLRREAIVLSWRSTSGFIWREIPKEDGGKNWWRDWRMVGCALSSPTNFAFRTSSKNLGKRAKKDSPNKCVHLRKLTFFSFLIHYILFNTTHGNYDTDTACACSIPLTVFQIYSHDLPSTLDKSKKDSNPEPQLPHHWRN